MKKATLIIWVIIFGFIALVIFQNQAFFLAKQTLRINLGVLDEYHTPLLPNAILALIFFFAGLLISYLFSISARFKAKRTIRKLNATITAHNDELADLKREINKLKGIEPSVEDQAQTTQIEMDETQKIVDEVPGDKTEEFPIDIQESKPNENLEEKPEEKIQ